MKKSNEGGPGKPWFERYGRQMAGLGAKPLFNYSWTDVRRVRVTAVQELRGILKNVASGDEAKRSANQLAKFRKELEALEAEFRKKVDGRSGPPADELRKGVEG